MPTKAQREENPAVQEIANLLAREFNKVEPRIKGDLKKAYRRQAKSSHTALLAAAKDEKNEGPISGPRGMAWVSWYHHTNFLYDKAKAAWSATDHSKATYADMPPLSIHTWAQLRKWADYMKLDYSKADQDSKDAFDDARDSFIRKNVDKVRNVLEGRKEIRKAIVSFGWRNGVFTGSIEVALHDGSFEAEIGLKYVIRTIPHVTPYFQYPLNFTTATIAGTTHARPSEEELRVLLGGKPRGTPGEELAALGYCPTSGTTIPYSRKLAGDVMSRMSPYMRCPDCQCAISVRGWKWRKHFAPAPKSKCEMHRWDQTSSYDAVCVKCGEKKKV